MMIEHALSDLEAWASFFREARLPVLRHTVHELDALRENAENVNARVLSGIILSDPLMTLRVLAYIESHRRQRQTTDITTIERALLMIGVNPFFRDFQDLPLLEDQLKAHPKALLGVLKVIGRARKAAHWAHEWAALRHDLDVDEITVAALLHDFTEILMWCFAPGLALQMRDIQHAERSRRSADIQGQIYGLSLHLLKAELVKAWHLPALLNTLLASDHAENPRVRNVKLAVDLARHSANGWDDAALPDDLRAIGELIHMDREHLVRKLGLNDNQIHALEPVAESAGTGAANESPLATISHK